MRQGPCRREGAGAGRRAVAEEDGADGRRGVSALARAVEAQERAAVLGFDWPDARGPVACVREETDEVAELLLGRDVGHGDEADSGRRDEANVGRTGEADGWRCGEATAGRGGEADDGSGERVQDEVGDLLFAIVNLARAAGVEPRAALDKATDKFERRFGRVRELAGARGVAMPGASLERLDRLWDEVKAEEAAGGRSGCQRVARDDG